MINQFMIDSQLDYITTSHKVNQPFKCQTILKTKAQIHHKNLLRF